MAAGATNGKHDTSAQGCRPIKVFKQSGLFFRCSLIGGFWTWVDVNRSVTFGRETRNEEVKDERRKSERKDLVAVLLTLSLIYPESTMAK